MQENHSFDNYFGTYPGANGIKNGVATACIPDPQIGGCVHPYHDTRLTEYGGGHTRDAALADIDGGKMDGFLGRPGTNLDVVGYHNAKEIPNYWAYAQKFVLQDRMFESVNSWSLPAHLYMVSGWSAHCTSATDPMSCVNDAAFTSGASNYAWTDITYLLNQHHVSWRYYVFPGTQPDCADDEATCPQLPQDANTPGIWNPL